MEKYLFKKYLFKNYRTRRFSQKTFEQQGDYFVVADVVLADNPTQILEVVAYWGTGDEEDVRKFEDYGIPLPKSSYDSFYGEFVNVPYETPLLRRFTDDDVYRGLCEKSKVGTYVCNPDGSVRLFNSIRVFSIINPAYIKIMSDPRTKDYSVPSISKYLHNWDPKYRAEYKKRYCYVEVSD